MKAIVLAGGFAKRLWPLTKNQPKPLLPVAGKPIIDYIIEKLLSIEEIDRIYISSNRKFEQHFVYWLNTKNFNKEIEIFAEPATSESEKLGAVGALGKLIKEKGIDDDVLIVAGDNIFDFEVNHFLSNHNGVPLVALYDMQNKDMIKNKYGVVVLDENNTIQSFYEKPEDPPTTLISTGCYFFPKKSISMIHEYLKRNNNPDAPGFFISWLSQQTRVQGFVFNDDVRWFDIGSIESYEEAQKIYSQKS